MLDEELLNKKYMPYVSRAKTYGGPTLLKAVGPALLTKNWQNNSMDIRDALVKRFGVTLASNAAKQAIDHFVVNNTELKEVILVRYTEIYEQTTTTA